MDISIIGAGLGGLSAASLLAAKGHKVTVFEKNDRVGGKMNLIEADGFTFDTGPSLLTMPFVLERLFEACGKTMANYLTLKPLDPLCRYNYPGGASFDCYSDRVLTQLEIYKLDPDDIEAYSRFLDYSEKLYKKTSDAFIFNPLFSFTDFLRVNPLSFFGIDAFTTVHKRVEKSFKSDYLKKFFKRFTTYNGSSPYLAPATLNVIPHVELDKGGFYVDGGMYKIAETLFWLASSLGAEFRFSSKVEQIQVSNKKVTGVITEGELVPTDLVIANSDATETIVNLLTEEGVSSKEKEKAASIEPSCSGFVMLLGIDTRYEELVHHNIFFSKDYEKEFTQIFKQKKMPEDPTIYVANTSFSNPSHAPEGGSNLFILVNAPYLSDRYDWGLNRDYYAEKLIKELENRGLLGLRNHIKFQEIITPEDFYEQYLSNKGSIYGTSSNNRFSAFARPKNKSKKIDGLYFVGGSTHPGGGIPLVIQSVFNAVELIDRYE